MSTVNHKWLIQYLLATLLAALILPNTALPGTAWSQSTACARSIFVQEGETLTVIAAREFGNQQAYAQIVAATNAAATLDSTFARIENPNAIVAGSKLCMRSGTTVTQPAATATPLPTPGTQETPVSPVAVVITSTTPSTTSLPITTPLATPSPQSSLNLLPAMTPTGTTDVAGSILAVTYRGTVEVATIDQASANFYPAQNVLPAVYAVDEYRIRFTSYDLNGAPLELVAQLFVPHVSEHQLFPIYTFGSGTTGIDDACAPSLERPLVSNWGDYRVHMLTYAAQGYIGILPDYEGFNDPQRIHHYFVAQLEAHALLDAARAVYRFLEDTPPAETSAQPEQAVFFAGYSQGGHAAFAARDLAASYAPELAVQGIIGYGPTTNIIGLLRANPYLAPYIVFAYGDLYGTEIFDADQLLLPRWSTNLESDALTHCVGTASAYFSNVPEEMYQPVFLDALYNNRLAEKFPTIYAIFTANNSGLVPSDIPALILQGTGDPIVPPAMQEAFIQRFCATGGSMTYMTYADIHHFQTRQVSFRDTLAWMEAIQRGETPPSVCRE
jgi:predicted esterase